jgi:SAM-dependent methyltransferase
MTPVSIGPRAGDVNLRAPAQMFEYEAIVARIAADRPSSILDWGCGFGQVSDLLLRAGLDVASFDYGGEGSPDALVPMERYPAVRAFKGSDPRRLPYETASFDAVLSCGVLEHVTDPDASLDELRRILRPGGTLYVYKLPNERSYLEKVAKRMGLYHHGQLPDDTLYTRSSARALLERHGFEVTRLRLANMLPLTVEHPVLQRTLPARALWLANRALARVPGVNLLATNVELIARSPRR